MTDTRGGDDFEALVAPLRRELHAHCYRMLGSVHDADDALQEALLGAWKGFAGFEGRSSLRSWLYTIATHACLAFAAKRGRRLVPIDVQASADPGAPLDAYRDEPIWLEPYPDDPAAKLEERERVELAFVAALQHLPGNQRAMLLLCEVMDFEASEVAAMFDTTVASVNSALQRARATVAQRTPPRSQQAVLRDLGDAAQRELVARYIDAWDRADATALVELLRADVRFSMPPIPTWFAGRDDVGRFFAERVFATPWKLVPVAANGQLAFACYQGPHFRLGAFNFITVSERAIVEICGFLDPAVHRRFSLPMTMIDR
ncbi:MAG TPA: RNA polymerase subunit sigma-70 [Kofleriaceae bacterium]|nr:RNA polymerase subunit sigma-70 [Kofleriaceae bacterium]